MKQTIVLPVLLFAISAWAGDLTVDNLKVSSNATIYNQLVIMGPTGNLTNSVATGGSITTNGSYFIHTFTTSGTFTVSAGSLLCDVLVVGGGGGGGGMHPSEFYGGGGGGAGGVCVQVGRIVTNGAYSVTVGAGGTNRASGSDSVFDSITAKGGGRGGDNSSDNEGNGGSGGGCGANQNDYGHTTQGDSGGATGYGNDGAGYDFGGSPYPTGGGGGASGPGQQGIQGTGQCGAGGTGVTNEFSGSAVVYGGGGGGGERAVDVTYGVGGVGGGGDGGESGAEYGEDGDPNTGGGGGGGEKYGGTGGSGIVIIRYSGGYDVSIKASDGAITGSSPAGDLPMGTYTNQ